MRLQEADFLGQPDRISSTSHLLKSSKGMRWICPCTQGLKSPNSSQPMSPARSTTNRTLPSSDPGNVLSPSQRNAAAGNLKPDSDTPGGPLSPSASSDRSSTLRPPIQASNPVSIPQRPGQNLATQDTSGPAREAGLETLPVVGSPEHMLMRSISTVPKPGKGTQNLSLEQ